MFSSTNNASKSRRVDLLILLVLGIEAFGSINPQWILDARQCVDAKHHEGSEEEEGHEEDSDESRGQELVSFENTPSRKSGIRSSVHVLVQLAS